MSIHTIEHQSQVYTVEDQGTGSYTIKNEAGQRIKGSTKVGKAILAIYKNAPANTTPPESPKEQESIITQATEEKTPGAEPTDEEIVEQNAGDFYDAEEFEMLRAATSFELDEEDQEQSQEELEEDREELADVEEADFNQDFEESGADQANEFGLKPSDYADIYADVYFETKEGIWMWLYRKKLFTKAELQRLDEIQNADNPAQVQRSAIDVSIAAKRQQIIKDVKDIRVSAVRRKTFEKIMRAVIAKYSWMQSGPEAALITFLIADNVKPFRKIYGL
mgnify:CR=1 FL=1